jgi:hypothetical protein
MSGWANKNDVIDIVKSTIVTDWNRTGLSKNPSDYSMTKLISENFHYVRNYGWYASTGPEEFVESLRRNLKRKKTA